jgi:flagellar biosynthesis protein FlhB
MEGKDGRTERATPKKRKKEREEGNLCVSPEIISMATLLLGIISLRIACPSIWQKLQMLMADAFRFQHLTNWTSENAGLWFWRGMAFLTGIIASVAIPVAIGAVVASMAQTRPYFSWKAAKWKFSKVNPVKGIKNLFNMQSIVKLFLGIFKVTIIVVTAYILLHKDFFILLSLSQFSGEGSLQWILMLIYKLALTVVALFVILAAIDYIFKKYKYEQSLMMTKQEVKEERKQEEISPHVRRKQISKMREFSLMRMMAAVPQANVVITNPTKVAVAIQYDSNAMDAPKVTAKGLRLIAERIKKIARENNVPIVERPPTARALYKHVKVGQSVPPKFYKAVAQVLAYLHKIGRSIQMNG